MLKLIACTLLAIICYQDFKERQVYWFLFFLVGLVLGMLNLNQDPNIMVTTYIILLNWSVVSCIVLLLYIITTTIFRKKFFDHSFGMGDLLLFYAFGLGFPTITFIILFTSAILFSLSAHMLLKKKQQHDTVPLAGYMSLFLCFVIGLSTITRTPSLYNL